MGNNNQNDNQMPNQLRHRNNMPAAAFISGVIALIFLLSPIRILDFLCLLFSILAIVFGAKGRQAALPNQVGMAAAGLVLGIVCSVIYLVKVACLIAGCTAFVIAPLF